MRVFRDLVPAAAALISFNVQGSLAFWRLPCRGRSGLGMIDPLVDPGKPSTHVHTVQGGNNFGLKADAATLGESECTSCGVKQDKSAYWTPALYFIHANGSTEILRQPGGMLAYYLLYSNANEEIVEFPKGFELIAGNAFRRNFTAKIPEPPKSDWAGYEISQEALMEKSIGFNCLHYDTDAKGITQPEASLGRHFMPDKPYIDEHCTSGVRLELFFPSCWNGKDAASEDHTSHMAYPSIIQGGDCPQGYPKRVPSLFYETIWDTTPFKGVPGQFALSNGDPTGFGYHGDFIAAWEDGFLQKAIDTCTNPSGNVEDCPIFDLISQNDMQQCTFPPIPELEDVQCEATRVGLPGKNPLSYGPQPAPKPDKSSSPAEAKSSLVSAVASSGSYAMPSATAPAIKIADAHGGGKVFANAVSSSSVPAPSPAAAAYHGEQKEEQKPPVPPTSNVQAAYEQPPPPSESPTSQSPVPQPVSSTIKDGALIEIYETEVTVTVTAGEPAPSGAPSGGEKHRRHLHHHHHQRYHLGHVR